MATPFVPLVGNEGAEACHELGPDGYMDLGLKFDTQEFVASLGEVNDRDTISVQLTGALQDGTQIQGEDVILILKKGRREVSSTTRGLALEKAGLGGHGSAVVRAHGQSV